VTATVAEPTEPYLSIYTPIPTELSRRVVASDISQFQEAAL